MSADPSVENDVYERYAFKLENLPSLITPSEHSDEMELVCAQLSRAVYGVYLNTPPAYDYIPSQHREEFKKAHKFKLEQFFDENWKPHTAEETGAEGDKEYCTVVSDRAGALMVWQENHLIVAFRGTAN